MVGPEESPLRLIIEPSYFYLSIIHQLIEVSQCVMECSDVQRCTYVQCQLPGLLVSLLCHDLQELHCRGFQIDRL